jgi:hypothetical protein
VRLPRDRGDLAVILVQKPGFVSFVTEATDAAPAARGLPVWLVGRAGDWNIPASPGIVAQIDSFTNQIQVEGLAARVGSSGGPLISSNGIVGMIVRDNDLYTEATPLEPIQMQVREKWHYAWQLIAGPIPKPTPPRIESPAVSPPPGPGATPMPAVPGRYPQFSIRVVAPAELAGLSCFELRIARNEMFARHGFKFHDKDLMDHFAMQPWYNPIVADVSLTPTESKNVDALHAAETRKGC